MLPFSLSYNIFSTSFLLLSAGLDQAQWNHVYLLGLQVQHDVLGEDGDEDDEDDHDVMSSLCRAHMVRDQTALGCGTQGIHQ